MMDEEKIDHDLKNRISQVFDTYEDTAADEGWAMLRQKYPPKSKDKGLAWLWYAAAAVVLLCLGIWFIPKPVPNNMAVIKTKKSAPRQTLGSKPPVLADTAQQSGNNSIAGMKTPAHHTLTGTAQKTGNHAIIAKVETVTNSPVSKTFNVRQNALNISSTVNINLLAKVVNPKTMTDSAAKQPVMANAPVKQKSAPVYYHADSVVKNSSQMAGAQAAQTPKPGTESAISRLLNEKPAVKATPGKKPEKAGKSGMFSVYAATYFNYAQGSDNQLNVGAGFTSDFHISKRFKLSTGLAIAQNTLSYSSASSSANTSSADMIFGSTTAASTLNSNVYATSNAALVGFTAIVAPSDKKYNAALIGLDIPINLKYEFNPEINDIFVSAGLSSGTFINETYKSTYTYRQSTQENTASSSFSRFDLAKTLNVSFGVGYPLGKSNILIIEPFLKYPLDGVGEQQIRFGSGGINLKLNFRSAKK